uniref:DNA-directed RNA polymerase subunit alpha n=1 Tax=Lygodium japonicum TaxID=13824 RepID=S4UA01_LYGJA|nr:RNA polymerase a-subunit [Lygodium japonicum]AGI51436.1 RNA polymerase a-subunit [Lygodium japonicum]
MMKNGILIYDQTVQCKCVESKIETDRLYYSRFAISPFKRGQAGIVGIAMRKASLGEVEGTSITYAKFREAMHEYSTITGIQETIHGILINLKETVFRSDSRDIQKASLSVTGPKKVTAGDILLPPTVRVVDHSQYIATVTQPVSPNIDLIIEKGYGYQINNSEGYKSGEFPIDAIFTPVRNASHSIHPFESPKEVGEISFIETWTDGSMTPSEALCEASKNLIDLFDPFLQMKRDANCFENNDILLGCTRPSSSHWNDMDKSAREATSKNTFIDQLELPARVYHCLKRSNINTVLDLLDYTQEDLQKIKSFGKRSVDQIVKLLWERFSIELPSKRL